MQISIIIPAYNQPDLLRETLGSVRAQTRLPNEVIVIDDGSPDADAVRAVVDGFIPLFPLRYHYQANGGQPAARNKGLHLAIGDTLCFLDHDDLLKPTALAVLAAALGANPLAAVAYVRTERIDASGSVLGLWQEPNFVGDVWERLVQNNFLRSPGCALIRRAAIETVGEWDTDLPGVDDFDLWLRLAERYPFVRAGDEPLFQYREHSANASRDQPKMRDLFWACYEKHLARLAPTDPVRHHRLHQQMQLFRVILEGEPTESDIAARRRQARHQSLRAFIERSGLAGLYRRTPLDFRLWMRDRFGVSVQHNSGIEKPDTGETTR